jgi:hypothetical protein
MADELAATVCRWSCGTGELAFDYLAQLNVIGIVVLTVAAVSAHSVALAGFGLDSLIEIGAAGC